VESHSNTAREAPSFAQAADGSPSNRARKPRIRRSRGRKSLKQGKRTPEFWRNIGRNEEQRRRAPPSFCRNRGRNKEQGTNQVNGVFIALVTWQLGHKIFFLIFLKEIFFAKEKTKDLLEYLENILF